VGIIGLSTPIWFVITAILLFFALLVVRFTFALVHEIKDLGRGLKRANERLQGVLAEVRGEAERASAKVGEITTRRGKKP
jgi:hypothetical protein